MRKSVLIIAVILILLVISGCRGGSTLGKFGRSPTSDDATARKQIYTGTKGLEFQFMKNLPPTELFDTNNIQLVAEIKNSGTHTIKGIDFYLSGYDPNVIQGIDNHKEITTIEGKSEFLVNGGYDTIRFESTDIVLPKGTDEYRPRLILTACYEYETLANPIVCIDPNKYNPAIEERGACDQKDLGLGGGQGAPVSVSRVDVDSTPDQVFFRIEINNAGGGKVVDQRVSRTNKCPFDLNFDDLDEVSYDIKLAGGIPDKCSPLVDGLQKVKLADNRATITCSFKIPQDNRFAYTTPVQIKLNYGYVESTTPTEVRIFKTGR